MSNRETLKEATKDRSCLLASLTTVLHDLETHKLRLDGPFHSIWSGAACLRGSSGHREETTERNPQGFKEDAEATLLQRQEAAEATRLEALKKGLFALETHEESLDQISSSHLGLLLKTVHAPVGC